MSKVKLQPADSEQARTAIRELVEGDTVLVEVNFPKMGTSPDWFLCEDQEDVNEILKRLAPGAEVYINSVWDLKNLKGTTIGLKV